MMTGGSVHYELRMDHVLDGNRIANPSGLDARLSGYATYVSGARDGALLVDGRDSFIRVSGAGHRHECFGDLSKCPNGIGGIAAFLSRQLPYSDCRKRKSDFELMSGLTQPMKTRSSATAEKQRVSCPHGGG